MASTVTPPHADEIPDFFRTYISHVAHESDAITTLERQKATIASWGRMAPDRASFRYAEGKWSVKEVIGHLIDTERIFACRLLRIARGDQTPLPAFDENTYAASSNADARDLAGLVHELTAVRESSLALVRSLDDDALANRGTVRAGEITARAQVFVLAGHLEHHARLLRERYGVAGG